jgi:hypothetical protein
MGIISSGLAGENRALIEQPAQDDARYISNPGADSQRKTCNKRPVTKRLVTKGLHATENPARWGSTDGAVQSKSNARFNASLAAIYPLKT